MSADVMPSAGAGGRPGLSGGDAIVSFLTLLTLLGLIHRRSQPPARALPALRPASLRHDVPAPRVEPAVIWVLVQTAPTTEVLAASADKERLKFEMNELCELTLARREEQTFRWVIRPADYPFARPAA